jgi:penicillin amidase
MAAVLIFSGLIACAPSNNRATPQGLSGGVEVIRDRWGVPHIRARTDLDAFYAQGYVHAQDRLWQMEISRRTGAGRLSEILGSAALENDKFLRTWGFYRAAEAAYPALSERTKAILNTYAAGVNAFIAQGNLPIEFSLVGARPEPWKPADSLVWAKMLAFNLSGNWDEEVENVELVEKIGLDGLNALKPIPAPNTPTIVRLEEYRGALNIPGMTQKSMSGTESVKLERAVLDALKRVSDRQEKVKPFGVDDSLGSNNWVIAGSRTTTGKPMLANDPHLGFSAPSLWYLADLRGDTLNAIGATLPGVPGVVLGRNDRIAWGATNVEPDTQDLFVLNVKNGAYQTPNGPVKLETREEIIKVGNREEKITIRSSAYGPVISDLGVTNAVIAHDHSSHAPGDGQPSDGQAVALRWTSLEPGDTTLDAFLGFNYARNWADFREAMRAYVGPMQSFVYADVDGNIGYFAPGKIPIRNWDGRLPANAARGQNWTGYRSFEDLPSVLNPREGFIVTANNKVLPHQATWEPSTYNESWRAQRIRELILRTPKISLDDMVAFQADTESVPIRELIPGLLALTPKSDAARRLQAAVRAWNPNNLQANLDSSGPTAYAFYHRELVKLMDDELGRRYNVQSIFLIPALKTNAKYCLDARNPAIKSCTDWMSLALERGAAALEVRLGSDSANWRWGNIHKARFNATIGSAPIIGPFLNREIANVGTFQSVNVAAFNFETFIQSAGPSLRTVMDASNMDGSRYIHPMGQSGDPLSRRYDDFLELWRDVKYILMSTQEKDWGATERLELKR